MRRLIRSLSAFAMICATDGDQIGPAVFTLAIVCAAVGAGLAWVVL
jgi:hypothetical protein